MLLVVDENFLRNFQFSAGTLQVPFVTKFKISTGELISSRALSCRIDSILVAHFIADGSRPRVARNAAAISEKRVPGKRLKPQFRRRIRLWDTDEHPISSTYYLSLNPAGTRLAFTDHMTFHVYVFDLFTGKLLRALYPDSSEEALFIRLPAELVLKLKAMNIINSMYFSHRFLDDSLLIITASLPSIRMRNEDENVQIDYFNAPVMVTKSINSNQMLRCVEFQSWPDTIPGVFEHPDASLVPETGIVFLPYCRGWPAQGSEIPDENLPADWNPFREEFYLKNIHQLAVYDTGGRFIRFIGKLDSRFEELRLGYLVNNEAFVRRQNNRYYAADRYSGKILISNQEFELEDSIVIWENATPVTPAIDHSSEPLRYMLETFRLNFPWRIVDFLDAGTSIYALVTSNTQTLVYKLNLQKGKTERFLLHQQLERETATYHLLQPAESGVVAIGLATSSDDVTHYFELQLP
ncbi:MAG: hypothetical protein N2248_06455 [candidate division WOR-3 bacterium]|uniref:6-bladed beta-propeller n=1 Tax=candidate division WOR-3 bacterium TaxID=2052148 RepID=A0A7C3IXD3_UNCW3|nr:hypothetical protein [candidate division WOR-3 bacterium]